MKKITLAFIAFALLLSSCQEPKKTTASLKVNLAGTAPAKLEIFNIEKDILHSPSDRLDSFELEIKEAVILNLQQLNNLEYIYIKPTDQLVLDTTGAGNSFLSVQQPISEENKLLKTFAELISTQDQQMPIYEIGKSEPDSFLLLVQQKFEPLEKLIGEMTAAKSVDKAFKEALKVRLLANKGNDLMAYKNIYNYYNKKMPNLPQNFYHELTAIDFTNPNLLTFEEGRRFGNSWASKDISFMDYPSVPAFYAACLKAVQKAYPNTLFRDYCLYDAVYNNVNFGGGIDESDEMIADFKASVTNQYLTNKLEETIAPWLALKSGSEAPDFVVKNRTDGEVLLSSLKGKKVYIDVWATWCGPCIREIPALKELEKELHDENIEFVSVSIDQAKDKEKWLNFIKEKELGGLQLMANGDWKSDIATAYNIKGIPRFLLIDEAGKIISANAPRPSTPNIKEVLLN